MAAYRTSFQCPTTGQTVIARYAFGWLTVEPAGDDDGADEETQQLTAQWCKQHHNRRFPTLDTANEYIIDKSDGQALGLEEQRY